MKDEIAARLREARAAASFRNATEAAASLGVKYPTYAGHENGTRAVGVEDAILYARRFKVSLDWLLTGSGRGPGGEQAASKITDEPQILAMLARVEGLSDTDIEVARAVIMNALAAKRVGSGQAGIGDRLQPASRRHEVEPSR